MAKKDSNVKKRHFFKDFKAELKKVIWPTPKQVVNNTIAVIVIVLITALIVFILDRVFGFINSEGINGLKSKVKNTTIVENMEQTDTAEETQEQTENEAQEEEEPSTSDEQ